MNNIILRSIEQIRFFFYAMLYDLLTCVKH